jgi:hypothetical protein
MRCVGVVGAFVFVMGCDKLASRGSEVTPSEPTPAVATPPPPTTTIAAAPIATDPMPTPSSTAAPTASAATSGSPSAAVERVQAVVPHFLKLLAKGDDSRFIDEAVNPEDAAKLFAHQPKAELVKEFKADKHEAVVHMLDEVLGATPKKIREENGHYLVTYAPKQKDVTFVVIGPHVYIQN